MLMPSIFGENLFDDLMSGFPFGNWLAARNWPWSVRQTFYPLRSGIRQKTRIPGKETRGIRQRFDVFSWSVSP